MHHSAVRHSVVMRHSTVEHSVVRHNAVSHRTTTNSAVDCVCEVCEKTGVQGQVAQCSEAQYSGYLDCELSEGQYVSHSVVVHKDSCALCPPPLI